MVWTLRNADRLNLSFTTNLTTWTGQVFLSNWPFCLSSLPMPLNLLCSFRLQALQIGTECVHAMFGTGQWFKLGSVLPITKKIVILAFLACSGKAGVSAVGDWEW